MDEPRLRWNGNNEAQRQADEAYSKLRDKPKKRTPANYEKQRRRNKRNGRVQYREYMVSQRWKRKRRKAIKFYGSKCQQCGASGKLYVHHKNYKHLGNEQMEDLEVLCLFCHEDRHADKVLSSDPMSVEFREIVVG